MEGRYIYRRVDKPGGKLPAPREAEEPEPIHARSITLSSNRLGLIAKMDLVEGDRLIPVDYKRGKCLYVPRGAYEPERVQLCVQGMILSEHGYRCEQGCSITPPVVSGCPSCSTRNCTAQRHRRPAPDHRRRTVPSVSAVPWWAFVCRTRSTSSAVPS